VRNLRAQLWANKGAARNAMLQTKPQPQEQLRQRQALLFGHALIRLESNTKAKHPLPQKQAHGRTTANG
jgi:hypothetical protein